jgi:hypothetical protein
MLLKILISGTFDMQPSHSPFAAKQSFYEQVTLVKGFFSVFVFIGLLFLFWLFRMLFSTLFLFAL